ncbi:MAG: PepSY domain-containing protein [Burkholderiales bacterium]
MSKPTILLVVAVGAMAGFAATPAQAGDSTRSSPFHRCVNAALAVKPGQVLEVEQETEDGRQVYEVDILGNDGTRWELKCDMATIKIIKVEVSEKPR